MDSTKRVAVSRARNGRWIGGVCAGLAQLRGFEVGWVRVGFVLLALLGGLGIALYFACWLIVPAAGEDGDLTPGGGIVEVAQACGAAVGLIVLAGVAAAATLFGFGWVVLAVAVAVVVAVSLGRSRLGPAWSLLPVAAMTLPAVAVAASGLRLAPQAGPLVYTPKTGEQVASTVYRSGLGMMLIDLRHTALPSSGAVPLRIEAGVRRTIVALPANTCVRVDVHYDVNRLVAGLGGLLSGRTAAPYSYVTVFGRLYRPSQGDVTNGSGGSHPVVRIAFSSQGGSLYVRDYPDSVNPSFAPDWPGYVSAPEPPPSLSTEPRKLWPMIKRAYRQRSRTAAASERRVEQLMPGPCG